MTLTRRTDQKGWGRLQELRLAYLDSSRSLSQDYWKDRELLELYDRSLGRRIAWKWEAVLEELVTRDLLAGLLKEVDTLIDWGCGSGVASEIFLGQAPQIKNLTLLDRSSLATRFSMEKHLERDASLKIQTLEKINNVTERTGLLVSHVLNEIDGPELSKLKKTIALGRFVLWVEPGSLKQSRQLSEIRDSLHAHGFRAWAPCLHTLKCPVLADGKEGDWCHFFADTPSEVHHSAEWREISLALGIDLRSTPYSFLLLSKDPPPKPEFSARILQRPNVLKSHVEVEICADTGQLAQEKIDKRSDPENYKLFKKNPPRLLSFASKNS